MSSSSSICVCKTEGISFPFSFPISPTQFQGRILKPIYSGFVESSNFALSKISFHFKRMIWHISCSSAGLRFYNLWYSPWSLYYCWRPGAHPALQQPLNLPKSCKELLTLWKSLAQTYEDTGEVPWCYVHSQGNTYPVSFPIIRDNNSVNREAKATVFKLNWWSWD